MTRIRPLRLDLPTGRATASTTVSPGGGNLIVNVVPWPSWLCTSSSALWRVTRPGARPRARPGARPPLGGEKGGEKRRGPPSPLPHALLLLAAPRGTAPPPPASRAPPPPP